MSKAKFLEASRNGGIKIEGLRPQEKYYLIKGKDYVLLKKMSEPSAMDDFMKIASEIQKQFKEKNITKTTISKAIKWARKK